MPSRDNCLQTKNHPRQAAERHIWLAAVLLTVSCAASTAAHDLTVATRSALERAQREVYFEPYTTATGVTVRVETWNGDYSSLQRRLAEGKAELDLVQVNAQATLAGCRDGLFEKLDWPAIGGKDHYLPQAVSDCGVGAVSYNTVLVWDHDKFPGVPTWSDFWDVAKYPGKRGMRQNVKTNLEIALMADGVSPGDVYRVLRSDDGVERAFRKLDQLKPYLMWWKTDDQALHQLGAGDVLLSTAPNIHVASAAQAEGRRFGVQWSGSLYTVDSWVIVKDAENAAPALKLLAFMGDPAAQARLSALVPYGGSAKGATNGLTPEQLAQSPGNPANLAVSLQVDDQFWRENQARLSQRFEIWLAS